MCPNDVIDPKKKGFMDFNLFKKIVDEICNYTQDIYLHHRGEPLLHPKLFEMIKYAKNKGLKTKLHSNATQLTEEKSIKLLESELDFISFSFDGYTKETYEQMRVGAKFDLTLNNIIRFLELKKDFGKSKPYTILQFLDFPDSDITMEVKQNMHDKFRSLPLDEIREIPAHNWGGNVELGQKNSDLSNTNKICTFPWYSLTILWDGTVTPCPQDFLGEIELGNVTDHSIRTIWNGKKMMNLREKMTSGQYKCFGPCSNCDRLQRKTIFGSMIPRQNFLTFISESISGYDWKKPFNKFKNYFRKK
jgi:radical SAM protein with 4Fe4S-binding SPASM domain